jgi:hypothetical protein
MCSETLIDKQIRSCWRRFFRAVFSGIGGNLVILVFLMTFLHIFETIRFMPWILAFNAALTGFALVGKTSDHPAFLKTISALAGLLNVLVTCGLFVGIAVLLFGDLFMAVRDFVIFLLVGVVCCELGTLLALRYYRP